MIKNKKNALGKGLSALIPEQANDKKAILKSPAVEDIVIEDSRTEGGVVFLSISELSPGKFQPRGYFDEENLKELCTSIKENGVLQPILVRKESDGQFQIIAGERRWRASKQAGLDKIPSIIKELTDKQALEVALVENIQRQSLTPIEEAEGYKKLISEFGYTQEKMAESLGKSRSHITNMLRLLNLPDEVKDMINTKQLSMGHARALINAENPVEIAHEIVRKGLSVREAEKYANGKKTSKTKKASIERLRKSADSEEKDEDLLALEQALSNNLGLRVTVEDGEDGGKVTLYFNNLSELDKILQKLE